MAPAGTALPLPNNPKDWTRQKRTRWRLDFSVSTSVVGNSPTRSWDGLRCEKTTIPNNQVVLLVQNAHPLPMAKTWISKRDVKAEKAFIKAIRLLSPKAGRRQYSRPR